MATVYLLNENNVPLNGATIQIPHEVMEELVVNDYVWMDDNGHWYMNVVCHSK